MPTDDRTKTEAQALITKAIEEEDNDELGKLLLEGIPPSALNVKLAAARLASVSSEKRRESVDLLIKHGWNLNNPLGVSTPPLLRRVCDDPIVAGLPNLPLVSSSRTST